MINLLERPLGNGASTPVRERDSIAATDASGRVRSSAGGLQPFGDTVLPAVEVMSLASGTRLCVDLEGGGRTRTVPGVAACRFAVAAVVISEEMHRPSTFFVGDEKERRLRSAGGAGAAGPLPVADTFAAVCEAHRCQKSPSAGPATVLVESAGLVEGPLRAVRSRLRRMPAARLASASSSGIVAMQCLPAAVAPTRHAFPIAYLALTQPSSARGDEDQPSGAARARTDPLESARRKLKVLLKALVDTQTALPPPPNAPPACTNLDPPAADLNAGGACDGVGEQPGPALVGTATATLIFAVPAPFGTPEAGATDDVPLKASDPVQMHAPWLGAALAELLVTKPRMFHKVACAHLTAAANTNTNTIRPLVTLAAASLVLLVPDDATAERLVGDLRACAALLRPNTDTHPLTPQPELQPETLPTNAAALPVAAIAGCTAAEAVEAPPRAVPSRVCVPVPTGDGLHASIGRGGEAVPTALPSAASLLGALPTAVPVFDLELPYPRPLQSLSSARRGARAHDVVADIRAALTASVHPPQAASASHASTSGTHPRPVAVLARIVEAVAAQLANPATSSTGAGPLPPITVTVALRVRWSAPSLAIAAAALEAIRNPQTAPQKAVAKRSRNKGSQAVPSTATTGRRLGLPPRQKRLREEDEAIGRDEGGAVPARPWMLPPMGAVLATLQQLLPVQLAALTPAVVIACSAVTATGPSSTDGPLLDGPAGAGVSAAAACAPVFPAMTAVTLPSLPVGTGAGHQDDLQAVWWLTSIACGAGSDPCAGLLAARVPVVVHGGALRWAVAAAVGGARVGVARDKLRALLRPRHAARCPEASMVPLQGFAAWSTAMATTSGYPTGAISVESTHTSAAATADGGVAGAETTTTITARVSTEAWPVTVCLRHQPPERLSMPPAGPPRLEEVLIDHRCGCRPREGTASVTPVATPVATPVVTPVSVAADAPPPRPGSLSEPPPGPHSAGRLCRHTIVVLLWLADLFEQRIS